MTISVVVPCFNEEESIPLFYEEMERVRTSMGEEFEYIFINHEPIPNRPEVRALIIIDIDRLNGHFQNGIFLAGF